MGKFFPKEIEEKVEGLTSSLANMSDYMYGITINVMDKRFAGGAKPNQVDVDSLPAFNAARDYAENYSYTTIKIPAGVYYIDDYFEFPSNCRIIGDGKYKTFICPTQNYLAKLKAKVDNKPGLFINKNWNVEGIVQYQAVRNVLIQDIGFIFDAFDTSINYLANAITLINSGNVTISGCYSLAFPNHLIDIGNCEHVTVERCKADGHVFSPIQIDCDNGGVPGAIAPNGRSKHINIRYNIITGVNVVTPAIHIHKNGGDYINIEHNIIEDCPFGIGTDDYFDDNFAIQHMSYVRIRNNTIINATSYGNCGIGINTALINSTIENNHIINAIKGIQLKPNVSSSTLIKSTCRITGNDVNADIPLTIYGLELSQITGNKCVATVDNNPIIDIYGIQKSNIDKNTLVGKTNSIGIKINPLSLTDPRDGSVYTYICSSNNIAHNVFDVMFKAIVVTDNNTTIDTRIIGNIYSAVTTKYDLTSAYKRKIYISDNEPYISDFMLIDTSENKTKTYNHYMDFSNRVVKITLLVADDANGTNVREIPHCAIAGNIGITVKLTDTQYTIQAGKAGLFYDIDSSGTTTLRTSAYVRVILS